MRQKLITLVLNMVLLASKVKQANKIESNTT